MSGPAEKDQADRLERQAASLRRRTAEIARSVADTEEHVAETLEKVAQTRPPSDAGRLRAKAEEARRFAAVQRDRSAKGDAGGEPGDRSPQP